MAYALLVPILASASIFSSLLQKTALRSDASVAVFNSQTMPLLASAVNIDPSPATGGGDITLVDGTALLAQEGPSGTAADIESRPANSQISVYVVRDGDTLSDIAKMFGVTKNTIIGANDLKGGVIHPGDNLIILPITGLQHTVIKGETLSSLAVTYKSDMHDIALYNNLADDATLKPGDVLLIPNAELGATSAPEKSATPAKPKTIKQSPLQLARQGKQTAPLRGANGPEIDNYYAWPLDGGVITQGLHGFDAVDIGAPKGTDIYAAAAGTVLVALSGGWNGGYGSYVVIQHNNGTQTLYAHMSKVLASQGDTVNQGDVIGKVGATGEATGPHLHFEVRGAKNPYANWPLGSGE